MRDNSVSIAKGITIAPDNMTRRLAIIISAYKVITVKFEVKETVFARFAR